MLHRGYHKIEEVFIYDLVKKENGILMGRIDGTERWVACRLEHLVIEEHTKTYDVNHRPIFEEDVLRDKNNNRYRVVHNAGNGLEWSLYHIEGRSYYPLIDMQRFEVIGNRHVPFQTTEILLSKPFNEEIKVLHGDIVLEVPTPRKEVGKASVSEIINENKPNSTTRLEERASLIPSFLNHSQTMNRTKGTKKRKKQGFFTF